MGSRRLLYTAYSALLHDEQVYAVCRANTEMEYHLQINALENGSMQPNTWNDHRLHIISGLHILSGL